MKKILSLLGIYFGTVLAISLLLAFVAMICLDLTILVAGEKLTLFSLHFFLKGLLNSVPFACVMGLVFDIVYLIRHPQNMLASSIVYVVLGLFSWLFVIPSDLSLLEHYENTSYSPSATTNKSTGIFRKSETGIFYYSQVHDDGNADGLFIDVDGLFESDGYVIPFYDVPVPGDNAFPYADVVIKNAVEPPELISFPLGVYNTIMTAARYTSMLGFLPWLWFASIGFALISVFGLQFVSSWRLANYFTVLISVAVICLMNYYYYIGVFPKICNIIGQKISYIINQNDGFIILANLTVTLIFTLMGILFGLLRRNADKKGANE